MENIGSLIKKYRHQNGMSQEELGKALFTSKQTVSKWENALALPDIDTIRKISEILRIPVSEILQKDTDGFLARGSADTSVEFKNNNGETAIEAWRDYKFGMFIHYGVYSMIGRMGEWVMFYEPIDIDEYADIAKGFTAENFSGEYYASLAKKTGMKYMVLTTRHHDGFCLFDSKHSHRDFTVMSTACGRDLVREYCDACREAGLGVGLYYSPMDWRFEGYFFPKMYKKSAYAMRDQAHAQIKELVENYGKIDIMWYDGGEDYWFAHTINLNTWNPCRDDDSPKNYRKNNPIPEFWGEMELDKLVRGNQPHIVINNRLGGRRCGDYATPERVVGGFDPVHPWETCTSLLETWGWTPNKPIMSFESIIHMLVEVVTGGGNLLLNVSPMGDGSLEKAHEERLLEVGRWMEQYGEFIYGTRGGPIKNNKEFGGFTCKGNSLYFFLKSTATGKVKIPILGGSVMSVACHTGEIVRSNVTNGVMTLSFEGERTTPVSIAEVEFDRPVSEIFDGYDYNSFDAFENIRTQ